MNGIAIRVAPIPGLDEEESVDLLVLLLIVFLVALVAGFGWRMASRRRRY